MVSFKGMAAARELVGERRLAAMAEPGPAPMASTERPARVLN